jgi:hypothetical protein
MTLKERFKKETGLTFECEECQFNYMRNCKIPPIMNDANCFPTDGVCRVRDAYIEWLEKEKSND